MLENIFTGLYNAMTGNPLIALAASFGWGILSILLSPCHLSSIPLIIGYINSQGKISIKRTFLISIVFSSGILVTIAIIGAVTASLGRIMGDLGGIGNYIVAAVFLLTGLYLTGIINFSWNSIIPKKNGRGGIIAALSIGLIFGLALGPCTFAFMAPVLGVVFQTAKENILFSVILLAAFGTGHCSVITGAGVLTGKVQQYLDWSESSKTVPLIRKICGILVILGGIYTIYAA